MKLFLSIAAILAWLFGFGLLLAPSGFYAPLQIVFTPLLGTIAQAHGATLIGVGVINWMCRSLKGKDVKPVLIGNLVIQILSFYVAVQTFTMVGNGMIPALLIPTVLGLFFAFFVFRTLKQ